MREKAERFAVIGKIRISMDKPNQDLIIAEFDHYPSDEELENVWNMNVKLYKRLYHIHIEKQIRFN